MASQTNGGRLRISLKGKRYRRVEGRTTKPVPAARATKATTTDLSASDRRRVEEEESEGEWISSEVEDEDEEKKTAEQQHEHQQNLSNGTARRVDRYDFTDSFLVPDDLSSGDDDAGEPHDLELALDRMQREHAERREEEFRKQRESDLQFWVQMRRLLGPYIQNQGAHTRHHN